MRAVLAIALLFAAGCPVDDPPPPGGGGGGGGGQGGGGGGGGGDGGFDGDGGDQIFGRLCDTVDLRVPLACPAADLSGIDVAAGTATATTGDAGTFTLDVAPNAGLLIEVSGGDEPVRSALFTVGMWSGDDGLRAPIANLAAWDDLVAALAAFEPDGTASIALYIEDQSGPIADAEILPPDGSQAPYYDDGAPDEWMQGGLTSIYGAALVFAVPSLGSSAELLIAVDAATYPVTVPVRDDTLTFARVILDTSGQ